MNGKIVVQINKGAETIETVRDAPNQRIEAVDREKSSLETSAITSALIQAGTQAIRTTVSQYGDITGDYVTSNMVSEIASLAGDALMVARGGIVGVIAVGTKYGLQAFQSTIQTRRANQKIEFMRERTGGITMNNGRYY